MSARRLVTLPDDLDARAMQFCQRLGLNISAGLCMLIREALDVADGVPREGERKAPLPVHTAAPPAVSTPAGGSGAVKPALQRIINAIGWWHRIGRSPIERDRACVVAGLSPKASTFGVYVSELIKLGLVETSPGKVGLTDAGLALAEVPPGHTREQLHTTACGLLAPQERRVFDVIYAAHPNEIARDAVADAVGLSKTASTIGVYISAIAAYGIIENGSRGHVRAAGWLFP